MSATHPKGLQIIKTGRTLSEINAAIRLGYKAVVKPVIASPDIRSKFALYESIRSKELVRVGDFRAGGGRRVLDFTWYYPHHFPEPFAAYLAPPNLVVGQLVWLEDLIEDLVGAAWNQGDTYRLDSCEALWTGEEFMVQHTWEPGTVSFLG